MFYSLRGFRLSPITCRLSGSNAAVNLCKRIIMNFSLASGWCFIHYCYAQIVRLRFVDSIAAAIIFRLGFFMDPTYFPDTRANPPRMYSSKCQTRYTYSNFNFIELSNRIKLTHIWGYHKSGIDYPSIVALASQICSTNQLALFVWLSLAFLGLPRYLWPDVSCFSR